MSDDVFINELMATGMSWPQAVLFATQGDFSPVGPPVTAHAGGGRTGATQLGYGLNVIGTVATVGDSVVFPKATVGAFAVFVANNTFNSPQLFALGSDTINNSPGTVGIFLAPGATGMFFCIADGQWFGGTLS